MLANAFWRGLRRDARDAAAVALIFVGGAVLGMVLARVLGL